MSELLSPRPEPSGLSASDNEPTMVTSMPSRIHTVPRPRTITQCHLAQGNRSIRAGMSVVILPVCTPLDMRASSRAPPLAPRKDPYPARRVIMHTNRSERRGSSGLAGGGRVEEDVPHLRIGLADPALHLVGHLLEVAAGG